MKLKSNEQRNIIKFGDKSAKLKRWTTKNEKDYLLLQASKGEDATFADLCQALLYPNIETDYMLTEIEEQYLIAELRKLSVGDKFISNWYCSNPECEKMNETELSIETTMKYKPCSWGIVELVISDDEKVIVEFDGLKSPEAKDIINKADNQIESVYLSLLLSIKSIQINEEVFDSFKFEDLDNFIREELPVKEFDILLEKYKEMLDTLTFEKTCKCQKCKKDTDVVFEDLSRFLPW